MAFAVEFTRRAERDLDFLYAYIHAERSAIAHHWLDGLEHAISIL